MQLKKLLKDAFNIREEEYTDDKSLMELEDWDSMSHMVFITQLEEEFKIELDGGDILSLNTIGDVKSMLQKKGIKNDI